MRACVRASCAKNATWARRGALRVTHDGSMCAANERAGCAGGSQWFGRGVTRARRSSAVVRDAFLALGARPAQLERECRRGEAPGRCASGSARSGGREGGDKRRGGLCARGGLRGCPWQGGTSFAVATYPDTQKTKKNIRTVGFEPTPSKRPVPETGALDRSARSARFTAGLPLVYR